MATAEYSYYSYFATDENGNFDLTWWLEHMDKKFEEDDLFNFYGAVEEDKDSSYGMKFTWYYADDENKTKRTKTNINSNGKFWVEFCETFCDKLEESDSDEEDEEEEKGDWCYGVNACRSKTYIMAGGGSHWWNYVVEFDTDTGEQTDVYVENKDGRHIERDRSLFVSEDGNRLALELERPGEGWTMLYDPDC